MLQASQSVAWPLRPSVVGVILGLPPGRWLASAMSCAASQCQLRNLPGWPTVWVDTGMREQMHEPQGCAIPALEALPDFAKVYRSVRAETRDDVLFECEYGLVPSQDSNDVGLLCFVAYPIVSASCYADRTYTMNFSTTTRDVYYFANSEPSDTLIFRLHCRDTSDGGVLSEARLSRRSNGVRTAFIRTHKQPA